QISAHIEGLAGYLVDDDCEAPPARDLADPFGDRAVRPRVNGGVDEVKRPEIVDAAVAVDIDRHRPAGDDVAVGDRAVGAHVPASGERKSPGAEGVVAGGHGRGDADVA